MEESEQRQPASQLFGGVLPDKRVTQSSQKVVDFNAKQITSALKAEATALQALHVYLFKGLKDLEVERTCLESLRRAVASGEHEQAPPQPLRQGPPGSGSEPDPCSRLLDRLLPVDAPVTDTDITAATAAPSTARLAAAHTPAPPTTRAAGRGRGATGQRKARQAGRASGTAPVVPACNAARSCRRQRSTTAAGRGGSARRNPQRAGHGERGGGGGAAAADRGAEGGVAWGADVEGQEQHITMDDLLGTALSHEELLAQLDAAQEILGQGLEELLHGGNNGVGVGAEGAVDVAHTPSDGGESSDS